MKVEVHIVAYNEERILPFALRHYWTFADQIIVYDGGSTDETFQISTFLGAEVRAWDTHHQINDELLTKLKNEAWLGSSADWVIFVDADEFIHFPLGAKDTLAAYDAASIPIVKTHGYEMVSDVYPTTKGQIYDEIKMGGVDNTWYAKPALWSPKRVKSIAHVHGAHGCRVTLKDESQFVPVIPTVPPTYLLHFKHIEPVEDIGARYAAAQKRFAEVNIKNNWGCHSDPAQHARDKRATINRTLQRVMP